MNASQFDCRWCGKSAHLHGEPGASSLGGPNDRLCPPKDGREFTSQFYAPKVLMHLLAVQSDLRTIQDRVANALAWIDEVIDA